VSLISTPLPTWNGVAGAFDCAGACAGGGSEKVRSSVRTRMLLDVSALFASGEVAGGAVGFTAGFAATGVAGFAATGAAGLAAGALELKSMKVTVEKAV